LWLFSDASGAVLQVDYAYVYKMMNRRNKERLWDHFFGMFDDYYVFAQVLDQCTNNYECLVLDQTGIEGDIASTCHFWKAPVQVPSFKLGGRQYWQFHLLNYDPDNDSDSDSDAELHKKKRVNVRRLQ
jgi:hypothetical protein